LFLPAGDILVVRHIIESEATSYDLTITPWDSRGNAGLPEILTIVITGAQITYLL